MCDVVCDAVGDCVCGGVCEGVYGGEGCGKVELLILCCTLSLFLCL